MNGSRLGLPHHRLGRIVPFHACTSSCTHGGIGHEVGGFRAEFPGHGHKFVQVVESGTILGVGAGLQFSFVAGGVEDAGHNHTDVGQAGDGVGGLGGVYPEAVHEFEECGNGVFGTGPQGGDFAVGGVDKRIGEAHAKVFGVQIDGGNRAVADAAAGCVDDTSQGDFIGGVVKNTQVGYEITDFFALVEAGAAHHLVGDAGADEDFFDGPGGVIGAVHDGNVPISHTCVEQSVDFGGDESGFIVFVVGNIAGDFRAGTMVGPEFLFPSAMIVGDHGIGRGEDVLGGTIILLQQDCACLRIVAFEFFDIANGGAAERIDGLVGIANHAEFTSIRSGTNKRGDENVLGMVSVLVLINKNVTKTFSIIGGDFGVGGKHPHGFPDEIVEVESIGGPQPPLVFGVHLGNGAVEGIAGSGRLVTSCVGVGELGFQRGDSGSQQPGWKFLGIDL